MTNVRQGQFDRVPIDAIYDKYLAIVGKMLEISTVLGQVIDLLLSLDREIKKCDPSSRLMIAQRLRMKIILGVVFPMRQYLERLIVRMNACASSRESTMSDAERPEPIFE